MTGRVNPAIISLLVGRQSKERLRLIDARYPIASTYLGTTWQITRVQHVRYDRCVNKNTKVLLAVSVDSVWILSSCLLIQLMKRKRVWWKQEMTPLGNEVDWMAQVFIGAKKKNRRFSAKESTMLRGSSQYTLRYHLTAMPWEVVIRDQNRVKS